MSEIAQTVLASAAANVANANADRHRQRTAVAELSRLNAAWKSGIPFLEYCKQNNLDINAVVQMIGGIGNGGTNQEQSRPTVDNSGSVGGTASTEGSGSGFGSNSGQTQGNAQTAGASGATASRPGAGSTSGNDSGRSGGSTQGDSGASAKTGTSNSTETKSERWKAVAAILTALGIGVGGGSIVAQLMREHPAPTAPTQPPPSVSAKQQGSLYQWLEDQGYHLPEKKQ